MAGGSNQTGQVEALRVEGLTVSYGALTALENVSWSVRSGEVLGVIGPNGAGKTTSFAGITNRVQHTGEVYLFEETVTRLPTQRLARLGIRAGPRLLMLDEPSVGLAPRLVLDLLTRIRGLVEHGLSVLLVEQNVRAVLDVADYLYLLDRGVVTAFGAAAQMRGDERIAAAYLGGLRE